MAKNKKHYKFTDKVQAVGGVVSIVFAALGLMCFGLSIWLSYKTRGNGGDIIGLLGVFSLWFTGMGLYYGIKSFRQEESFYLYSWIGTIANTVVLVGLGCIFLLGL